MHRVIVVGSPRPDGRSAHLADELFNACIEECPDDGVSIVSVASIEVGPCRGCDACRAATEAPSELPADDDTLAIAAQVAHSDALAHRCVIHDDMTEVRKHLDAADELIVVSPVYFASVPAQFKALLDRLQPYFWSNLREGVKRPCVLHVVGEGGDPHGFEPLVGTVRSALACAGFEVELVLDWVGKITPEGEITAEAEEYVLELAEDGALEEVGESVDGASGALNADGSVGTALCAVRAVGGDAATDADADADAPEPASAKARPRLSLSDAKPQKGGKGNKGNGRGAQGAGGKKQGGGSRGEQARGNGKPRSGKGGKRRG
ncbi:MAG: flavodoxin family protein [Eggerthellaceae bacterium]|nr:flavodoxin family protein [Eggerthellaceae bacterium]